MIHGGCATFGSALGNYGEKTTYKNSLERTVKRLLSQDNKYDSRKAMLSVILTGNQLASYTKKEESNTYFSYITTGMRLPDVCSKSLT